MSLRQQVLKGGAYLAVRQMVGLVLSFGGALLMTRLLGPANYGLYAGAYGIVFLVGDLGGLGVDVYLVRRRETAEEQVYHHAFTLLLLSGGVLLLLSYLAMPLLRFVLDPRFLPPLQAMLLTMPLGLVRIVPAARLERDLNYRVVSAIDISSQLSFYGVALVLALMGWGVWALIAGYWTMQVWSVLWTFAATRYRPRLMWSRASTLDMLKYGLGYQAGHWLWVTRTLVNPVVVGRYLGPEGVGYIALAIRLVETLGFVKRVTYRLSIAALAKLQGDYGRLRRALEEAMGLQVLAIGPLLAGFATTASVVLPLVFGPRWRPALEVFPLIAFGYMVNAVFNMHSSVLYVLRQNRSMVLVNAVHVVLFVGGSLALVPRFGLVGYGLAEIVALGSYAVIHTRVARLFTFSYAQAIPWFVGFSIPLFAAYLPVPWRITLWAPLLLVALLPRPRRQVGEYLGYLRWRAA